MAVLSFLMLIASLGMLWQSIWKKRILISEASWTKLTEKAQAVRLVFGVGFLSLLTYLFARSAELLDFEFPSPALKSLSEASELVHMFIAVLVVLMIIPLFLAMVREDGH